MNLDELYQILWKQYSKENPSVEKIHSLFKGEGEEITNDHIALRTFNDKRVGIAVLSKPFVAAGYKEAGEYHFPEKKLYAKHFELDGYPRVFISELLLEEFSNELKYRVEALINGLSAEILSSNQLVVAGSVYGPLSYDVYQELRGESEYAAWVYAFGYRANHFTISLNSLKTYTTLQKLNAFLKDKGYRLNDAGGEIKGKPEQLLVQSSTLADRVMLEFKEGKYEIPSCYYEFALRYPDHTGSLFSGFIAGSADKIFESTDFRK
ncbi:MAG: DUF1338 domain-containing protein [Bacteroidales bacterium]|jgi:hypothetical protein|nr:DUF1338 domain-containing protein [Bacteroidales bacterium]